MDKQPWTTQQTQTLEKLEIWDSRHVKPSPNHKHLRLYGHVLCPFVERVRLVLAAQGLQYQDVQINLERRTRWHKSLNGGFVPILETPQESGTKGSHGLTILESRIIMNYLDSKFGKTAKCGSLYAADPAERAMQDMIMYKGDQVAMSLYSVLMHRGQD